MKINNLFKANIFINFKKTSRLNKYLRICLSSRKFDFFTIMADNIDINYDNKLFSQLRGEKMSKHLINIIYDNQLDIKKIYKSLGKINEESLNLQTFKELVHKINEEIFDKDIEYIFKKFDKFNNGSIDLEEFIKIIESEIRKMNPKYIPFKKSLYALNIVGELKNIIKINDLDIEMIFEGFDLNSGDFIDLIKFQEIIEVINARYTEDEIKELFNIFEINKDGKISVQQLQQLLQ